jgi:radical SAM protein with 4Fe4S-binding SPASM domain
MFSRVKEAISLTDSISATRARNAWQILSSYYRSRWQESPEINGMPISIAIEPTTSCNLRCPECPSGLRSFTRPTGMLQQDMYEKIINELHHELIYLTFYFQGEPYLHSSFLDMVSYANSKKIFTATSTNAHFLNDEMAEKTVRSGLKQLIISIDGLTQSTYESYRVGGNLEKVKEGTKNIIAWKRKLKSSTPNVIFQFLVVKPNEHEIPEVYKLAKELGVDEVKLKTAQIYDYENGSDLIPVNEKYSRYNKQADGTYRLKHALEDHCWKMWHSCVITWDGKVVPCCFDKDAHYVLGDIKQSSFKEIWNGEAYNNFRRSLLTGRSEIEICKNCTEGAKVWA